MTSSPAGPGRRPGNRPRRLAGGPGAAPRIRPAQLLAVLVVLAAFTAGVVVGGALGAAIVGLLSLGAGALLVMRWSTLDPRIRVFRALVVLLGLAVAVSLYLR